MVAQPAAEMAAGSSSGEEAATGTGPVPQETQEQAAPSMMEMLALLVDKVSGIQYAVDQVSARTGALEGALADVSLSGSGEPQTGSGSMSVTRSVSNIAVVAPIPSESTRITTNGGRFSASLPNA